MGCNNTKAVPVIEDNKEDVMHSKEAVVNPLEAQLLATTQASEKNSVSLKAEQDPTKTLTTDDDSSTVTASKEETDAEFLQRMEEEDQKNFALAVDKWRAEKKAGKGEAKIVEAGGGFIRGTEEKKHTDSVTVKVADRVTVKVGTTGRAETKETKESKAAEIVSESKTTQVDSKEEDKVAQQSEDPKEDEGLGIGPFISDAIVRGIVPSNTEW